MMDKLKHHPELESAFKKLGSRKIIAKALHEPTGNEYRTSHTSSSEITTGDRS